MTTKPQAITTLTTITIAAGEEFPPDLVSNRTPERWQKVCRPLLNAPGFQGGALGHGIEHPEKGIIISGR